MRRERREGGKKEGWEAGGREGGERMGILGIQNE